MFRFTQSLRLNSHPEVEEGGEEDVRSLASDGFPSLEKTNSIKKIAFRVTSHRLRRRSYETSRVGRGLGTMRQEVWHRYTRYEYHRLGNHFTYVNCIISTHLPCGPDETGGANQPQTVQPLLVPSCPYIQDLGSGLLSLFPLTLLDAEQIFVGNNNNYYYIIRYTAIPNENVDSRPPPAYL